MIRILSLFFLFLTTFSSCSYNAETTIRDVIDFNDDWKFKLGDNPKANEKDFDDKNWAAIHVPHDWSIELGYQEKGETASSSGFVPGGIGWYRKSFTLNQADKGKYISIQFDGVYNNSSVWINGHFLGARPNGYITFFYDLTKYLKFDGTENVIAVKVDHSAYVDSRWYTGSGIYRKVQLIKKEPLHIAHWGVKIMTSNVSDAEATVNIKTAIEDFRIEKENDIAIKYSIIDQNGNTIIERKKNVKGLSNEDQLLVKNPKLWSTEKGNLYDLKVALFIKDKQVDEVVERFGIRSFAFDANSGFSLNGKNMKIKGVNLHHDAGAVGVAVPKAIWEYRVKKLKSIGVNAIRFAHNPHAKELLEVCDELGILVMNEAFDEWHLPKAKSKVYLGDNAAPKEAAKAYPVHFKKWAKKDLKDLIHRDYNHPSVFMWSIGNEIEWTFGHYSEAFAELNPKKAEEGYAHEPTYEKDKIKKVFEKSLDSTGIDPLATTAKQLVQWIKEEDTTRPVVCGSVLPSIGMVSGYGTAVDVYGFNYCASEYDIAHKTYPDLKIIGSENWGSYPEWKACLDRDFVSGVFLWTGFAYLGEAGPWPRKGLEISLFDYAGYKTPRGHFFETLWKKDPKVYMVTTPASESEFSYSEKEGWKFDMQLTPPPVWNMLRLWEWYKVYPKWNYKEKEAIVVQAYTNCEEAELFINDKSLGKQKLSSVIEDDHILKWLVPYEGGELKLVGYNAGKKVDEYNLRTQGKLARIAIAVDKSTLKADNYDVAVVSVRLIDENGSLITDADTKVDFQIEGEAKNIGVDNGWEKNIQSHKSNGMVTHHGKATIFIQSTKKKGKIKVTATAGKTISNTLMITSE